MASSVAVTFAQTGFSNLAKTFVFPADQDATDMIAAYQNDANIAVNGTATRAQVADWIMTNVFIKPIRQKIAAYRVVPAVPGAEPNIA